MEAEEDGSSAPWSPPADCGGVGANSKAAAELVVVALALIVVVALALIVASVKRALEEGWRHPRR